MGVILWIRDILISDLFFVWLINSIFIFILAGVNRRQRKINKDIRLDFKSNGDIGTKDTETQTAVFGHMKWMDNSSESIGNISIGYKKRGKTEEKMDRQCQRGSVSKRKRCITGSGMCKRQKEMVEVCSCSPVVGNLRVKTDGSKRKNFILCLVCIYCILLYIALFVYSVCICDFGVCYCVLHCTIQPIGCKTYNQRLILRPTYLPRTQAPLL